MLIMLIFCVLNAIHFLTVDVNIIHEQAVKYIILYCMLHTIQPSKGIDTVFHKHKALLSLHIITINTA